jgi:hypothetical protein
MIPMKYRILEVIWRLRQRCSCSRPSLLFKELFLQPGTYLIAQLAWQSQKGQD